MVALRVINAHRDDPPTHYTKSLLLFLIRGVSDHKSAKCGHPRQSARRAPITIIVGADSPPMAVSTERVASRASA